MGRKHLGEELTYLDHRRAIHLSNQTCPYCNTPLDTVPSNKEHVIGRGFVPRGTLRASWNLILRACVTCNGKKSDLEDDISAVTMQPASDGTSARDEDVLREEAARKARSSFSRRTGRSVARSHEKIQFAGPLASGAMIHIDAVAPPQVEESRAFELARIQLSAFFYWVTYDESTLRGGFWLGGYYPILSALRDDWGNPVFRGFMEVVVDWEPRVLASAADDYFRVALRRHPTEICWSWALEWNSNMRLIGFLGEEPVVRQLVQGLPTLVVRDFPVTPTSGYRIREEVPLSPEQDILFAPLGVELEAEETDGSTTF